MVKPVKTHIQTGGARMGVFNASWPFATLSATADVLQLSCLGRDYTFTRNNIQSLRRHRGIFAIGLRIVHTDHAIPVPVVFWASLFFWTSGFQKLKTGLENLGYEVRD
jgi:hypothetical protein